jgi:ATP-dependent RNA helicase DeaD
MRQELRLDVMKGMKQGKFRYLVATDVAARGIDIENISLVINYNLPHDQETYIHRTGRTGRAGKSGRAITFLTPKEEKFVAEMKADYDISIAPLNPPTEEIVLKNKQAFHEKMKKLPQRNTQRENRKNKDVMKLFFNGGKKKKLRIVDFVGTISNLDGVNPKDIGVITMTDRATFVEILNGKGAHVLNMMKSTTVKGKLLKVYEAKE